MELTKDQRSLLEDIKDGVVTTVTPENEVNIMALYKARLIESPLSGLRIRQEAPSNCAL